MLENVRTLLFTPADQPRKVERALTSGADAAILDLEGAVAPDRREAARAIVGGALSTRASALQLVRVNDPLGADGHRDLDLVSASRSTRSWSAKPTPPGCSLSAACRARRRPRRDGGGHGRRP